ITDDDFQNLAKVLFDAGRSLYKSSIEIKELLPHSTTVSRNVTCLYEEYKLHLVNICEQLNSFCLVVDQWKESYTVSDNEPKMLATFRGYCIRVGCADHYLNKQLQH
ncbi:unnamed protein product, partial [Rotaria magnacalcarata]